MKVIILAGGLGTRISEETEDKPKPMVLIGDKPILWHLMNIYAHQGYTDFVIATGYKGEVIDEWVRTQTNSTWSIEAIDTGQNVMTGGRIKRILQEFPNERVMVTYGDGLANINLNQLLAFHNRHEKLATVTAVRPPARFGVLESLDGLVTHFGEKNQTDTGWINGGFFVLEPQVIDYIKNDNQAFEADCLPLLVRDQQLTAYEHEGFWQPMDTLREKQILTEFAKADIPHWLRIK
jgi:glucose-1-phosphate cytidylyltransferase